MEKKKKLEGPVTLFAAIESKQHEVLRTLAFREKRSLADVVRQALSEYIERCNTRGPRERNKARTLVRV
jgi:hypothetical protein